MHPTQGLLRWQAFHQRANSLEFKRVFCAPATELHHGPQEVFLNPCGLHCKRRFTPRFLVCQDLGCLSVCGQFLVALAG